MNPLRLILPLLCLFVLSAPCMAGHDKKAYSKIAESEILAVSATSITIGGGNHQHHTYSITPETSVEIDSTPSKVEDLRVGMKAAVSAGTDPSKADHITAHGDGK